MAAANIDTDMVLLRTVCELDEPNGVNSVNSVNSANIPEAVEEVKAFRRGGEPGLAQLARVWPSIKKHYQITDDEQVWRLACIELRGGVFTDVALRSEFLGLNCPSR